MASPSVRASSHNSNEEEEEEEEEEDMVTVAGGRYNFWSTGRGEERKALQTGSRVATSSSRRKRQDEEEEEGMKARQEGRRLFSASAVCWIQRQLPTHSFIQGRLDAGI